MLLGLFAQRLDRPLTAQRVALAGAGFDVDQRLGRAGMEKARALAGPMGFEAPLRVVADTAVERAVLGAHQVDEPGFWLGGGHDAQTRACMRSQ